MKADFGGSIGFILEHLLVFCVLAAFTFLLCLGRFRAWNRRAERLRREPQPPPTAPVASPEVWPPPPNVPGRP
ncbi:MAG: hypothetical protein JO250_13665 [Armatimonadetes bacterium]|nr:hypothetical protein [Armatimonadota bacterium]